MIKVIPASNWRKMNKEIKQLYIDSFPSNERREWKEMLLLIDHPSFNLHQVFDNQKSIGLISFWNLLNFIFIEHFAIEETFQGKGVGSQVIRKVKMLLMSAPDKITPLEFIEIKAQLHGEVYQVK